MSVYPGQSSSSSHDMDPVSRVQQLLGAAITDAWPSLIIDQPFIEEPTDTTLRNIATFIYGNRVPIQLAIDLFDGCNGTRKWYAEERFHEWYYIYDRNTYKFNKAKYYSVLLGKMSWINGRGHSDGQVEAVVPEETDTKIGLGVACKRLVQ
jgi:hypothetical protein